MAPQTGGPVLAEEHPPLGQRQAAEGAMDWVIYIGPRGEAGRCDIRLSCRLAPVERRSEDLSGEGSSCPLVYLSWATTAYHPEVEWSMQSQARPNGSTGIARIHAQKAQDKELRAARVPASALGCRQSCHG